MLEYMPALVRRPDTEQKLDLLTESARFDVCLASCANNSQGGVGRFRDPADPMERWIYPATVPGRGQVGILKVLMTNACPNNCSYCALAACRRAVRRVSFEPQELAAAFMRLVGAGAVHGLFLSSGVGRGADAEMERMVRTAELLRQRYAFRDYIHLKVLPGASRSLVEAASRLATRLSINLESPNPAFLRTVAPDKSFVEDLLVRMKWIGECVRGGRESTAAQSRAVSQTTQFVVGAAGETDLDILRTVDWVYRELYVFRSYFSAVQPVDPVGGPTAGRPGGAVPLDREHRLYQSDFLLRGYGFRLEDLVFDASGALPREVDPKMAYAMMHPELYPLDVNRASEQELLRIPGIGPLSALRIVTARKEGTLRDATDLAKLGARARRAAPYIEFSGRRPASGTEGQMELFDVAEAARAQGWRMNNEPLQGEKIRRGSGGLHAAPYCYPAQVSRRLYYGTSRLRPVIRCR